VLQMGGITGLAIAILLVLVASSIVLLINLKEIKHNQLILSSKVSALDDEDAKCIENGGHCLEECKDAFSNNLDSNLGCHEGCVSKIQNCPQGCAALEGESLVNLTYSVSENRKARGIDEYLEDFCACRAMYYSCIFYFVAPDNCVMKIEKCIKAIEICPDS